MSVCLGLTTHILQSGADDWLLHDHYWVTIIEWPLLSDHHWVTFTEGPMTFTKGPTWPLLRAHYWGLYVTFTEGPLLRALHDLYWVTITELTKLRGLNSNWWSWLFWKISLYLTAFLWRAQYMCYWAPSHALGRCCLKHTWTCTIGRHVLCTWPCVYWTTHILQSRPWDWPLWNGQMMCSLSNMSKHEDYMNRFMFY